MRYGMQVEIEVKTQDGGGRRYEWVDVRPTGGQPYRYDTHEEAASMLRMCYPETLGARVVAVP